MGEITEYGPRIEDTEMFPIFDIDAGCESFGDKQYRDMCGSIRS
jgi:hypothetical protein